MLDSYNREISYMRISVTDKCNLRCLYCMPQEGIIKKEHKDFLSFEDIGRIVQAAAELGIWKIRLTGGEPLIKKDITSLVRIIKSVEGIKHIGITTNGTLLSGLAQKLKSSGLDSINISLDTLDPYKYREITRGGNIEQVLLGIEAAREARFPIKINTVVLEDTRESDIDRMRDFCAQKGLNLQLINHYSLTKEKQNNYVFDRPPKCGNCNRIRLLAHGVLKSCLQSDVEIPVDLKNPKESLILAIKGKPALGQVCSNRSMIEIGG